MKCADKRSLFTVSHTNLKLLFLKIGVFLMRELQNAIQSLIFKLQRSTRIEDADVRENRMIMIDDKGHLVVIYDLSLEQGSDKRRYFCLSKVTLCAPNTRPKFGDTSLPCVRWSPEGSFFTTTGTCMEKNVLRVFDADTTNLVESIELATYGSKAVFVHEHSRIDPALIAIGTTLHRVLIADLRTGNVAVSNAARHTDNILGIAWSLHDENLLVSASPEEVLVWDRRYLSKSTSQLQFNYDCPFSIDPDIKFLDSNRVLVMGTELLQMHDVYTGVKLKTIPNVVLRGEKSRYKFGLNRDAKIVYFPAKRSVRGVDLTTDRIVMEASGGHIYPVEMLFFNDCTKELYSLNRYNEAIVWTPFR